MTNGLYHKEVKWDDEFKNAISNKILEYCDMGKMNVYFTKHSLEQFDKKNIDKYAIDLRKITSGEIFEVTVEDNDIMKFVSRCEYNDKSDVCIVVLLKENGLLIKTCWLNSKMDKHKTLDMNKYER